MWQLFNNFNKICDILSFLKIETGYSESFFFPAITGKKRKKEEIQVRARDDAHCPITLGMTSTVLFTHLVMLKATLPIANQVGEFCDNLR